MSSPNSSQSQKKEKTFGCQLFNLSINAAFICFFAINRKVINNDVSPRKRFSRARFSNKGESSSEILDYQVAKAPKQCLEQQWPTGQNYETCSLQQVQTLFLCLWRLQPLLWEAECTDNDQIIYESRALSPKSQPAHYSQTCRKSPLLRNTL